MTTTTEYEVTAATIPSQSAPPSAEEGPSTTLLDLSSRQWYKGTGRAIGAAGDLVCGRRDDGTHLRAALPAQVLSVVNVRVRAALESSIDCADTHPHVAKALSAALQATNTGPAEVQVLSVRTDTPHVEGTERQFVEALAAVRGIFVALKLPLAPEEASLMVTSALSHYSSLALPGLQVVDAAGTPVTSWEWWPQYALVRLVTPNNRKLHLEHENVESVLASMEAAVASRSVEEFAAAATSAAAGLTTHPLHGVVEEAIETLSVNGIHPLGWVLSTSGSCAALLFPADMAGRNAASRSTQELTPLFVDRASVSVSTSPRNL